MLKASHSRGDTLIEVLFAFTVFSFLAVGALSIMNQGVATAQKALEITLVRQQIDAQAEAIRYIHSAYMDSRAADTGSGDPAVAAWEAIASPTTGKAVSKATPFGADSVTGACPVIPANKAFIVNAHTGELVSDIEPKSSNDPASTPYAQVVYSDGGAVVDNDVVEAAYGIWVESVRPNDTQNYVDFHIRTCWQAAGNGPPTTLGTIVRLYAPSK